MREYETVICLPSKLEESELEKEIEVVTGLIAENGGEIVHIDRWGKRRLAYEVQKQHEGNYCLIRYTSGHEIVTELENRFRINERMLRHLTIVADTPRPEDKPEEPEVSGDEAPAAEGTTPPVAAAPVETAPAEAAPAEADEPAPEPKTESTDS